MSGEELAYVEQAIGSNWVAPLGPMVDAFESEFAERVGIPYAVALSSGTAALHLGLRCLGVQPGDKVAVASLTFIASVAPVVYLGAEPLFVDASPHTWTLDPEYLDEALRSQRQRGNRVAAVVPVDLYGQPCDLDAIREVAARYEVPVLADSAEALGARYRGRSVGAGADAAVYSFNGNKIITTSGGGMLASEDRRLVEEARFLSQQARDPAPHYQHSTVGYNYRMSNILAAIGRAQLRVLDSRVARRRAIFESYCRLLEPLPGISFMPESEYGISTRWLTVIQIDPDEFGADREQVRLQLERRAIEARPVWKPMHLQPAFASMERYGGRVGETVFARGLCLPSGSQMNDDDIERVAQAIAEVTKC